LQYSQSLREFHLDNFRLFPVKLRPLGRTGKISVEAALKRRFIEFLCDNSGATAIEYGLIAAGIALAIIAAVNGLGTNLNGQFSSINNSLK
jgi:pilus assembly protein Flp/PilA